VGGDRTNIDLPRPQVELLKQVHALGKPMVLVLMNGSALAVNWAAEHIPAIIEAWYPGQAGGQAIADVLFGDFNPGGRLPVTFYRSVDDLPPFDDYRMEGHTYRYFRGEPLFPFGHGLSYTSFTYTDMWLSSENLKPGDSLTVRVKVTNTGKRAGNEVVQLYVTDVDASVPVPIRQLQGFERIYLNAGETTTVAFNLMPHQLAVVDDAGKQTVEPGQFQISVGGRQPTPEDLVQEASDIVIGSFAVSGD
jgi:beta-glucosidase